MTNPTPTPEPDRTGPYPNDGDVQDEREYWFSYRATRDRHAPESTASLIRKLYTTIAAQSQALAERERELASLKDQLSVSWLAERRDTDEAYGRGYQQATDDLTAENRRLQTELSAANDVLAAGVEPRRQLDEWRRLCVTGACESRLEQWRNFEELRARLTTTEKERAIACSVAAGTVAARIKAEKERDAACTLAQTTVDRVAELKAERDEARERIGALEQALEGAQWRLRKLAIGELLSDTKEPNS